MTGTAVLLRRARGVRYDGVGVTLDILSTRIYAGFANSQFGYAAAESLLFMALIAAITWLQRRAVKASNPDA